MKKFLSILLLIMICFSLVGCGKEEPLTELEQYAVDCVEQYKSKIANPDELKVHDIRWRDSSTFYEDNWDNFDHLDIEGLIHLYLDKSYQNEQGGYIRDISVFSINDGKITYEGNYTENDNKDIHYSDKEWAKKQVARAFYREWIELKKDDNSKISIDRVMKETD